jgi:intracellular sulfur oxidation DsrE/DsrF family protein
MSKQSPPPTERRSFLTSLNAGAASVAALALGGVAMAQVKSAPAARFEPARHEKDDWLDALPGKHRLVIDTTSAAGVAEGLLFAGNFLLANRNDYGLTNQDMAVIVVVRHFSTGYGFNDAMWAKYGASMRDPSTASAPVPKTNSNSATLASLAEQGVQIAICAMASRRIAGMAATATGATTDAVFAEMSANLIANGRLVSAGIVAVNRAQERGYTFVSA